MVNVLFCGNKNMFDGMLTSMLSILKRSEFENSYSFYIFTMDSDNEKSISDKQINFLNDIVVGFNNKNKVIKVNVTELFSKEYNNSINLGRHSNASLMRLLVDLVPNMPDKLLYLDTDVLFNKDIKLVYDVDLEGYEYASALDYDKKSKIDSGILLLNLKRIKETNLLGNARNIINSKQVYSIVQDVVVKCTDKNKFIYKKIVKEKVLQKKNIIKEFSKMLMNNPYPHNEDKFLKKKMFIDIYEEYLEFKNIYCGYYMSY